MKAQALIDLCRTRGLSLVTAESCTGGGIGAALTGIAGSSDVFLGGIIAYANRIKEEFLDVPLQVLQQAGAVSPETALAMSAGACKRLGADCGIAVTGLAGPDGGTPEKPVGLVYIAVKFRTHADVTRNLFSGDREAIRRQTCETAIAQMIRLLQEAESNA